VLVKKLVVADVGFTLVELLIVVAVIGIIAAIAIPNLLRARVTANEAQAIGDTRTLLSANQAYASANCGYFAEKLECLSWGGGGMMDGICIKNYPSNAPEFLGEDLGRMTPYSKSGYTRNYIRNGEAMLGMMSGSPCGDMSALDYCYTSIPLSLGRTGVRSFSGIAAGRLFVDPSGTEITCPVPGTTPSLE
jgi:prepilin-type N-terminal cleavage/methylation domain-containing protein